MLWLEFAPGSCHPSLKMPRGATSRDLVATKAHVIHFSGGASPISKGEPPDLSQQSMSALCYLLNCLYTTSVPPLNAGEDPIHF